MNIFIISTQQSLSEHLFDAKSENHTKTFLADLAAAREAMTSVKPDIIIVEHTEEVHEIFDVCRELKSDPDRQLMFIVLSDSHDTAFWLEACDAGVDEIIFKSAAKEILKIKFNSIFQNFSQQKVLAKNLSETQHIAMTAMTSSNELGQVIRFVQKTYSINNYTDLAENLFSVTNGLGLHCCLVIKAVDEKQIFSSRGKIKKLEENLLSLVDSSERFFDFGSRTIITYPNIVLLVKNMPIEDAERYGRIKDVLPALLDVLDAKIISLETSTFIQSQTIRLSESFDAIKRSFQYISELSRESLHEGSERMQSMLHELNNNLPRMGLEEDQEVFILDRVEGAINDSRKMVNMSEEMEVIFAGIHNNLKEIVEQQNQLLLSLHKSANEKCPEKNNETQNDDVELF